ncbi:MAG TPA: hypothetical protein VK731_00095 [Candidatus Cybelea sp.]|nr:hypothetical protein [Candidatus Cybelea sp.]
MSNRNIVCIAASRVQASRIVGHLINAGFPNTAISALCPDGGRIDGIKPKKCGKATIKGAGMGMMLGGAFVWLTGFNVLSVTGFGSLIIAGAPLLAALGSASRDGIARALADFGISEPEAGYYEDKIKNGGTMISVIAEDSSEAVAVQRICDALGAENIIAVGGGVFSPAARI